jgi:threonine synthase
MTTVIDLRCINCGAQYPLGAMHEGCPACATPSFRSGLTPGYDYSAGDPHGTDGLATHARVGGLWRYRDLLPVTDASFETSLGEGGTPLVPIPRLAEALEAREVLVKDESRNPTWSFKDRLASVAVSKARELGAETVVAASSGNAGVSLAAYAAAARLPCIVLTYPGIPPATAMLIRSYGAHMAVTTKPGRWSLIREGMRDLGWYPLTNVTDVPTNSPYGHEGYKTIAYELFEQLHGRVPDYVAIPVSYCEGLFGIWKGFRELVTLGLASRVPRMLACEPAGGPLLAAHQRAEDIAQVKPPPTIARGVGASVNAFAGIHAVRHSEGAVAQADDSEIRSAQGALAAEGLFVEPAAALCLAGLRAFVASSGVSLRDKTVVLVSTASGAKYAGPVQDEIAMPVELEEPTLNALARALPHLDLGRRDP